MTIKLKAFSEIEPSEPSWLWRDRIPLGAITILESNPGQGKTTLLCDLSSRITHGRAMPNDNDPTASGGVMLLQAEDSPNLTQKRLEATGADLSRVFFIDGSGSFSLPGGITDLCEAITKTNTKLVVIDPIEAFVETSLTNNQSSRKVLSPLKDIAEELNIAIVLIRHLTKNQTGNPLCRGGGSIALSAAARSILTILEHPTEDGQRLLIPVKNSLGKHAIGMAFEIMEKSGTSRVEWIGECDYSLELLNKKNRESTALYEAAAVLHSILADGPVLAKDAMKIARESCIATRTLRRAKVVLGVKNERIGFGKGGKWAWKLPDETELIKHLHEQNITDLVDRLCHGSDLDSMSETIIEGDDATESQRDDRDDRDEDGEFAPGSEQ